jgi:hypothetical protein
MDKKLSKFLLLFITFLTIVSVAATAYRYLVIRDYEVYDDTQEYLEE